MSALSGELGGAGSRQEIIAEWLIAGGKEVKIMQTYSTTNNRQLGSLGELVPFQAPRGMSIQVPSTRAQASEQAEVAIALGVALLAFGVLLKVMLR